MNPAHPNEPDESHFVAQGVESLPPDGLGGCRLKSSPAPLA